MAIEAKKGGKRYRDTVIGKGAVLDGTFAIEHDLRVEGTLRGKRLSTKETLIVGQEGKVKAAAIEVGGAVIGGRVVGALEARRQVYIEAGGRFRGILKTPRLVIEEGAELKEDRSVAPEEGEA